MGNMMNLLLLGHLCPALPRAIKTMKRGERVKLIVQPQCRSSFTFSVLFFFPRNFVSHAWWNA